MAQQLKRSRSEPLHLVSATKVPSVFICPLTWRIMSDPVLDPDDGEFRAVEREAFEVHQRQFRVRPLTGLPHISEIHTLASLKGAISHFLLDERDTSCQQPPAKRARLGEADEPRAGSAGQEPAAAVAAAVAATAGRPVLNLLESEVPAPFFCPLSRAIMLHPVTDRRDPRVSMERAAAEAHVALYGTNPFSGEPMMAADLVPDNGLRVAIGRWLAKHSGPPLDLHTAPAAAPQAAAAGAAEAGGGGGGDDQQPNQQQPDAVGAAGAAADDAGGGAAAAANGAGAGPMYALVPSAAAAVLSHHPPPLALPAPPLALGLAAARAAGGSGRQQEQGPQPSARSTLPPGWRPCTPTPPSGAGASGSTVAATTRGGGVSTSAAGQPQARTPAGGGAPGTSASQPSPAPPGGGAPCLQPTPGSSWRPALLPPRHPGSRRILVKVEKVVEQEALRQAGETRVLRGRDLPSPPPGLSAAPTAGAPPPPPYADCAAAAGDSGDAVVLDRKPVSETYDLVPSDSCEDDIDDGRLAVGQGGGHQPSGLEPPPSTDGRPAVAAEGTGTAGGAATGCCDAAFASCPSPRDARHLTEGPNARRYPSSRRFWVPSRAATVHSAARTQAYGRSSAAAASARDAAEAAVPGAAPGPSVAPGADPKASGGASGDTATDRGSGGSGAADEAAGKRSILLYTPEEYEALISGVEQFGSNSWDKVKAAKPELSRRSKSGLAQKWQSLVKMAASGWRGNRSELPAPVRVRFSAVAGVGRGGRATTEPDGLVPAVRTAEASGAGGQQPPQGGNPADGAGARTNRYSDEELDALVSGVNEHGYRWKVIYAEHRAVLGHRSKGSLKAKWESLCAWAARGWGLRRGKEPPSELMRRRIEAAAAAAAASATLETFKVASGRRLPYRKSYPLVVTTCVAGKLMEGTGGDGAAITVQLRHDGLVQQPVHSATLRPSSIASRLLLSNCLSLREALDGKVIVSWLLCSSSKSGLQVMTESLRQPAAKGRRAARGSGSDDSDSSGDDDGDQSGGEGEEVESSDGESAVDDDRGPDEGAPGEGLALCDSSDGEESWERGEGERGGGGECAAATVTVRGGDDAAGGKECGAVTAAAGALGAPMTRVKVEVEVE